MFNTLLICLLYPIILIIIIMLSKKNNFFDMPSSRKVHKNQIPNTSGIALYVMLIYIVLSSETSYDIEYIITTGSIITIVGFLDDRKSLTPGIKLCLLLIPILILVYEGNILTNLGKYEFIGKINLGKFSLIFTILSVGLLINSFNYIDGIDGLLSGITLTAIIFFIFLDNLTSGYISIFLFLIYGLIINLIFNFLPVKSGFKCFMGDTGSLFLGFFISFIMIYLYSKQNIHPSYLIWGVWYPVYDFLSVNILRLMQNKNIFNPDKIHFHHFILEYFKSNHLKSFFILNLLNISVLVTGYFVASEVGKIYSILLFIFLFIFFFTLRKYLFKKYKN